MPVMGHNGGVMLTAADIEAAAANLAGVARRTELLRNDEKLLTI